MEYIGCLNVKMTIFAMQNVRNRTLSRKTDE